MDSNFYGWEEGDVIFITFSCYIVSDGQYLFWMRRRRCHFLNIFMLYCFRWTVPFLDEKKAMSLRQLIRLLEEQGMVDLCYTEYDWNLNSMWCIHRGILGIQGCICNVIQWHPLIPGAGNMTGTSTTCENVQNRNPGNSRVYMQRYTVTPSNPRGRNYKHKHPGLSQQTWQVDPMLL